MKRWHTYSVRLSEVGRIAWPRGARTLPTWEHGWTTDDYDLLFFWTGRGRFRAREGWVRLRTGMALLLRPGTTYRIEQDPADPLGNNFIHFSFLDEHGNPAPVVESLPPEVLFPADEDFAYAMTRKIVETAALGIRNNYARIEDPAAGLICGIHLKALLMQLEIDAGGIGSGRRINVAPVHARKIRDIAWRITERPSEDYRLKVLADECGIGADRFARLFRSVMGTAPQAFIIGARVALAKRLLKRTSQTIGEIAENAGYRDIYFFSHQFKTRAGLSPSQFRAGSAMKPND